MDMHRITKTVFFISGICIFQSFAWADEPMGLYMNGQWDPACSKCWPSPRTDKNNHCKPADCALQGYYHCKMQNPPLAIDDDPRLVSLIKSGECTYAPREAMNSGEAAYVDSMKVCTNVLDKMAGRFNFPPDQENVSRQKIDFYVTNFKAYVLGSAYAQLKLAIDYDIGMGTQQNRSKANDLYNKAAMSGIPFAQYAVGARYAYGISVPQNKTLAIKWLNKALNNKPVTEADKKAQAIVAPCAIKLIEHLTPT
jgi:hypothetical protein